MQDAPRDFVLGAPRTPSVKPADGLSLSASEKRQFMSWAIALSVKLSLNQMGVGTALGRAH